MPITARTGDMFDWVTHTHSHLRGACPHACPYCYVQAIDRRFGSSHHQGPPRLVEAELSADYSSPRIMREAQAMGAARTTVFLEHTNDLFAAGIRLAWQYSILHHARRHQGVLFVLSTKNPASMIGQLNGIAPDALLGVTVESDITHVGNTVHPLIRLYQAGRAARVYARRMFITIEPVLRFSPDFADSVIRANPLFVNIGADSKGTHGLPEPTADDVRRLIDRLASAGVQIRTKRNLARIIGRPVTP